MVRPITRIPAPAILSICATLVVIAACQNDVTIGRKEEVVSTPPSFTAPDAEATLPEAGLISYCPTNNCPPGWTTCPDSRFPCDTNILADSRNCGACGNACSPSTGYEEFTCSEGTCKMECSAGHGVKNCDGLAENGCESPNRDPENCGACGVVCAVGTPCIWQDEQNKNEYGCGCPPGTVECLGGCRDLSANDGNCGACNNACDQTGGPGAPQYPNTYYGCRSSQCGNLKCSARFADCDGDIENGCETSMFTETDCGSCGNTCEAGQRCSVNAIGQPSCMCADGLTFCQTGEKDGLPQGYCADVSTEPGNCGGCGILCVDFGEGLRQTRECDFGKCVVRCLDGWANCNGAQSDGCEIDTKSDPRNCGGCGITCDLTLGQACVAGKCVVEPCDQADAGEVTR